MASGLREVVPYAVNFSIAFALLFVIGRKPLRRFVYQRHERLKDFIENSTQVFQQAQARHEAAVARLKNIDGEEQEIIAAEVAGARCDAEEMVAKGRAEAERMRVEASRLMAVEAGEIAGRVKAEFLDKVLEAAGLRLKEGLGGDDHKEILRQAQSRIEVGA